MSDDILNFESSGRKFIKGGEIRDKFIAMKFRFDGVNIDIVETYYWHLYFAYLVGKGYFPIKLEDHHYFSENSQFGTQMRQVKGGAIKAFQENLQQLVQLVKVHMIPLLKEVKQAEFFKKWFDDIVENDKKLQAELKKPEDQRSKENIKLWRRSRNEAVNHIKDKWVSEVDGGKMWQIQKSSTEQGLDFALLPQLFFGINLDNPLYEVYKNSPDVKDPGKSLQEQIEQDIHSLDITKLAREQIARFHYKFHVWLPTAIKETQITYKIKISALKQFYAQMQMYINFMKPLLMEITRKNESLSGDNAYKGFEYDNPDVVSLFDYSYSFMRLLEIRYFEREGYGMKDLEFSRFGLFLQKNKQGQHPLRFGNYKGRDGYIIGEVTEEGVKKYEYVLCKDGPDKITVEQYKKAKKKNLVRIRKDELRTFPIIEIDFSQKRRTEIVKTEQGPQQMPYMVNQLDYKSFIWNIFEIAVHRENLKVENLQLLETFIEEISTIKEDLLYYVNDLQGDKSLIDTKVEEEKKKEEKSNDSWDFLIGPFKGISDAFSPLLPDIVTPLRKIEKKAQDAEERDDHHLIMQLQAAEDVWKVYNVHKKAHGFIQY